MKKKSPKDRKAKTPKEKFIAAARTLGCDETGKDFERLFRKIVTPKKKPKN